MYVPIRNFVNLMTTVGIALQRSPSLDPVEISKSLIGIPSVSGDGSACVEYMRHVLQTLGFTCYVLEFQDVAEDGSAKLVRNLYARYGTASPNLGFVGHIDVVPPGDTNKWSRCKPFEPKIIDGILYGRGAVDMKSSIGAFVSAVSRTNLNLIDGSISFVITDKEEAVNETSGIESTLDWLKSKGEKLDFCIVGEPTSEKELGDMMKIGRRGILSFRIECSGKQGHVAYQELADNPIRKMVKILHEINNLMLDNGTDYFEPSNCEVVSVDVGNPAFNVIPERISSRLNVRYNTMHTADSLIATFKNLCGRVTADRKCVMTDIAKEGDPFVTEVTDNALLLADVITEANGGKRPRLSTTGGTSDARFVKKLSDLIEFGLVSKTAHHVDENTPIDDIYKLTDIYREFIKRFFKI